MTEKKEKNSPELTEEIVEEKKQNLNNIYQDMLVETSKNEYSFKDNLKNIRESKGLTQKEVADKLGIFVQSYSRYENTDQEPKLNRVVEIANILNVSLDELVFGINNSCDDKPTSANILKKYANLKGYILNFENDHVIFGVKQLLVEGSFDLFEELDQEMEKTLKIYFRDCVRDFDFSE